MDTSLSLVQTRIESLWANSYSSAQMQAGQPIFIRTRGVPPPPSAVTPVSLEEVQAILHYVGWPNRQTACVDCEGQWRAFLRIVRVSAHGAPGAGLSDPTQVESQLRIFVRILPHTPLAAGNLGFTPAITKALSDPTDPGLTIIGGGPGSGRSSTAASFFVAMARSRPAGSLAALTIESPIEYVLTSGSLSASGSHPGAVVQIEPGIDTTSWEAAIEVAVREDFDQVLLSEINPCWRGFPLNLGHAAAGIVGSGKSVFATANGNSFAEVFMNVVAPREGPLVGDSAGVVATIRSLRAIVLQQMIFGRGEDFRFTPFLHTMVAPLSRTDRQELCDLMRTIAAPGCQQKLQHFFSSHPIVRQTYRDSLDRNAKVASLITVQP